MKLSIECERETDGRWIVEIVEIPRHCMNNRPSTLRPGRLMIMSAPGGVASA